VRHLRRRSPEMRRIDDCRRAEWAAAAIGLDARSEVQWPRTAPSA
jgi:hypothetical protein